MEYLKKVIVIVTILSLVGGVFVFYAQQTKAASAFLYFLKEFIIYPIVRKVGNALENKLVNKVNGIMSGLTQKTPSFVLSWRNFTFDSQARGNDIFRAVLADANLCPFLKTGIQKTFGADKYVGALDGSEVKNKRGATVFQQKTSTPGLPSFQNLTNCTLPQNFNVAEFRNDFARGGGWATWDKLIQPQNNFFGTYALSLSEQQKQIDTELQSSRDQSIAGQGFLGQKLGLSGGASPSGCVGTSFRNIGSTNTVLNRCLFQGKEVTPALVLGVTAANSLDKKLGRIGGASQITDILLSLLDGVVNGLSSKIMNFSGQGSYDPDSKDFKSGVDFDETPQDAAPGGLGDPTIVCKTSCDKELELCLSRVASICGLEPDPETGELIEVCRPDPVMVKNCNDELPICQSKCTGF